MQNDITETGPMLPVRVLWQVRTAAEFEDAVRTILAEYGQPMDKHALFEAFRARYPHLNDTAQAEHFRQRMRRIRDVVRFFPDTGGYWFTADAGGFRMAPVKPLPPIVHPLQHYGTLADQCGCPLCVDWRAWRDAFDVVAAAVLDHERACVCTQCNARNKTRFAFLAVENRRNLWCETAYHIAHSDELFVSGAILMSRLKGILDDPGYTPNWWAITGGQYPMGYWFRKLTTVVSGAVSGALRGGRAVHVHVPS